MTGVTTMTATHAGKAERRDPSPSPGVKPASSGSSDEVEPWDEPPSKTNSRDQEASSSNPLEHMVKSALNFVGAGGEDEGLEDGDLPTLSLKKERVNGQFVSGERTTRPLNPPSTNGMEDVKDNDPPMRRTRAITPRSARQAAAQQAFWSQLNASPSPFESDLSRDATQDREEADDGPDDEMAAVTAARRASRARELDDVPKQEDETIEGDEEHHKRNVERATNSYDENGVTCIEYTLASIGDMCGARPSSPIKDKERPANIREVKSIREDLADNAEEHTAIEVEYVDPGPAAPRSPPATSPLSKKEKKKLEKAQAVSSKSSNGFPTKRAIDGESVELEESETSAWSSSRKNAVLAAMARRAKEDFQKHEDQKTKQGSTPLTPKRDEAPVGDAGNTSDIYNSFSPSEKRKFLKLINLGLTPSESTARVVEERQDKEATKTPGSSSRKKRLSFWKKSAKVDAARSPASPRSPTVIKDAPSVSSTAAVGEAEEGAVHLAEPDSAERDTSRGVVDAGAAKSKAYSPPAKDSSAIPIDETSDDELEGERDIGPSPMVTPESADSDDSEEDRNAKVVAGVIAAGAVAAGVGVVASHQATVEARQANYEEEDVDESSDEEEEDSVRGKFPRSGVNYYDGIRKEHPEEEDSDEEFADELHSPSGKIPTKNSRLGSLAGPRTPKSLGFNSLHENDRNLSDTERDAPVSKSSLKSPLSPLSPIGVRQSKSSNKSRSSPLSPGGGSTSARRRYLGIPMLASKGFTPLEEDDDSALANGTREQVGTECERKLPEGVQTTIAAAAVATAASAVATSQKSHVPEVAESQSEERPLRSMEDPFFGLDAGTFDAVPKQSSVQGTDKEDVNHDVAKNQMPNVDISLDSYLDSATIQSYGGSHHEQQSVVTGSVISGKSGYTAGTGMTGHTQSSRIRRPGAAKDRIAKAKKADKASPAARGWHESIRAAAATNNRVWDPKKGWVDYKDPNEVVQKDTSEERLHISLDGVAMRSPRASDKTEQSQHDDESHSPSVSVPFPPGWEKERNAMLTVGQKEESVTQQAPVSGGAAPISPRSVADSDQASVQVSSATPRSVASDTVSPKPQGWVDSMREASAEVSKDGRNWDPERGWVGLDKKVIESAPLSRRYGPETEQDIEADDAESDEDYDDEETDEKDLASPDKIFAALIKAPSEGKIRDAEEFAEAESRAVAPRSRATGTLSKPAATVNRSEPPGGASDAVVAGVGEKYVQLGDNGAVKSVRRDTRAKKEEKSPFHPSSLRKASASKSARPPYVFDDDKAPLLTEGPDESTEGRAPATMVVKEKVDADDFNLFTANDGDSLEKVHDNGTPSRRRGTGPVDVDEVDDLSTETESEDDDVDGDGWEPDSYMRGNVSPGMFVKPRNERTADPNFSSPMSAKTPPKLQKSRRDTSPIRSVGPGDDVLLSPRQVISPDARPSPRLEMSSPDESPAREDTNRTIEQTRSIGDDSAGSSSVKQLAQKWEVRARHGTQIVHNQSADSFEYDDLQVGALGDFGPSSNEHNDWSGEHEKPSPADKQEWKSFLGKKVQAESAAAMEETKRSTAGAAKPGIPRAPGPVKKFPGTDRGVHHDEQGDSSFSFGDGPSDGDSPAWSASSSAAARRRERALQQNSSPGGFSDVSPIPPQDEFGVSDGIRMEMQSDTGTAVEQSSFMKRLHACAAPLSRALNQASGGEGAVPNSHLEFMRTNPAGQASCGTAAGRFVPAGVCGRSQDVIREDDESDEEDDSRQSYDDHEDYSSAPTSPTHQILKEVKERSSSRGKSRPVNDPVSDMRSSSSVTSDDFGARTSYLEAIALRSAVSSSSKKKKSRRRTQDRDGQSMVSDATSESHSDRWQAFLERKASKTASPQGSQATTDISRAAERYASEKMEEMMDAMASRSKSTPKNFRSEEDHTLDTSYGDSSTASPLSPYRMAPDADVSSKKPKKKSESAKAAEELAAARVEAMMAAMTSSNLDEVEI